MNEDTWWYVDVIQSYYRLDCIKLHVEYVNLLLNGNFCYGENQSRKPIRERMYMYSNWTNEECETAILKEKTCHKDLEVSVVI